MAQEDTDSQPLLEDDDETDAEGVTERVALKGGTVPETEMVGLPEGV